MTPKTQLSLTATPGRRYSFSAKTEAVVEEVAACYLQNEDPRMEIIY